MKKIPYFFLMAISFIACSSDSDEKEETFIDTSTINIHVGESVTLKNRGNAESYNDFIASFDDNKLYGWHVGSTYAITDGNQKFNINVEGTVRYIEEPDLNWGAKSIVPPKISGYTTSAPQKTSTGTLYFILNGSTIQYIYIYATTNGKLTSSAVAVPVSDVSILTQWLNEHYIMTTVDNSDIVLVGMDAYQTDKASTIVGVSTQYLNYTSLSNYTLPTRYWYLVMYMPPSDANIPAATRGTACFKEIKSLLENLEFQSK